MCGYCSFSSQNPYMQQLPLNEWLSSPLDSPPLTPGTRCHCPHDNVGIPVWMASEDYSLHRLAEENDPFVRNESITLEDFMHTAADIFRHLTNAPKHMDEYGDLRRLCDHREWTLNHKKINVTAGIENNIVAEWRDRNDFQVDRLAPKQQASLLFLCLPTLEVVRHFPSRCQLYDEIIRLDSHHALRVSSIDWVDMHIPETGTLPTLVVHLYDCEGLIGFCRDFEGGICDVLRSKVMMRVCHLFCNRPYSGLNVGWMTLRGCVLPNEDTACLVPHVDEVDSVKNDEMWTKSV